MCHDIWFVWERAEYLQHDSDEVLAQVPFKVSHGIYITLLITATNVQGSLIDVAFKYSLFISYIL